MFWDPETTAFHEWVQFEKWTSKGPQDLPVPTIGTEMVLKSMVSGSPPLYTRKARKAPGSQDLPVPAMKKAIFQY